LQITIQFNCCIVVDYEANQGKSIPMKVYSQIEFERHDTSYMSVEDSPTGISHFDSTDM